MIVSIPHHCLFIYFKVLVAFFVPKGSKIACQSFEINCKFDVRTVKHKFSSRSYPALKRNTFAFLHFFIFQNAVTSLIYNTERCLPLMAQTINQWQLTVVILVIQFQIIQHKPVKQIRRGIIQSQSVK